MAIERNGKFITLSAGGDSIQIPYAAYESGKQTIATMVDQARTADGIVRGEVIAIANKIEMTWRVLTPETWSAICSFFQRHFYFNATYWDMQTNSLQTKTFYVGDRSAMPFMIDSASGKPKYYLDCKANIIGIGESV
jgi:hypothetical protein